MRKWIAIFLACLFVLGLAACGDENPEQTSEPQPTQDVTSSPSPSTPSPSPSPAASSSPSPSMDVPSPAPEAVGQEDLFQNLAGDSVLALILMEPTEAELAMVEDYDTLYWPQEYGETFLILPKHSGSELILQRILYDPETGEETGTEEIYRSQSGADIVALLMQEDIPEGYPTLRILVNAGDQKGAYDMQYYGRGDGRRDFYILADSDL